MAYRFDLGENLQDGYRRIADQQFSRALRALAADDEADAGIHQARKTLKRLRALLRLARHGLGDRVFRRDHGELRDIGALLSGERDRAVMVQTLAKLGEHGGQPGVKAALSALRKQIGEPADAAPRALAKTVAEASDRLGQLRRVVAGHHLVGDGVAILMEGVFRSYRHGRKSMDNAYRSDDDETFHDWRKDVQTHWRHMSLLEEAWPAFTVVRRNTARELSQILGDDHDLAVLNAFAATALKPVHARAIATICRQRQARLRASARPIGERLYADGPHQLRRRMEKYWHAAVEIAKDDKGFEQGGPAERLGVKAEAPAI